jgi:hypothetical protein
MRNWWIAALSLILLQGVVPLAVADSDPPIPEIDIIVELQAAVRADDKKWFVAHLHFPVRYFGKKSHIIRSKDWFLSHYTTIIGAELKASVLAQDPEQYFKNYQGLMVGEGSRNIWFEDFGDLGAGRGVQYEIITINNSD